MKDRRNREARGRRRVTEACKTRRRQWRMAADDCEQPGGVGARVFGGFWCGDYGGLYGAGFRANRAANLNEFVADLARVCEDFVLDTVKGKGMTRGARMSVRGEREVGPGLPVWLGCAAPCGS